jgi:hypothetical protein
MRERSALDSSQFHFWRRATRDAPGWDRYEVGLGMDRKRLQRQMVAGDTPIFLARTASCWDQSNLPIVLGHSFFGIGDFNLSAEKNLSRRNLTGPFN